MKRVGFVVDGLNLYHSIERRPHWHGFKWLNLMLLANAFIKPSSEVLVDVAFCTSSPKWNLNKLNRHGTLLKVYRDLGIRVIEGDIRKTSVTCRATCALDFEVHEEKQTDINVAMEIVGHGMGTACDKVFVVTGDSDQVPTVKFFKQRFPQKELVVIVPPGEYAEHLRSVAGEGNSAQITLAHLKRSLISEPYITSTRETLNKPSPWFNKTMPAS